MLLKTTSPTQTVAAFRTCQLHILIDADNSVLVGHVFWFVVAVTSDCVKIEIINTCHHMDHYKFKKPKLQFPGGATCNYEKISKKHDATRTNNKIRHLTSHDWSLIYFPSFFDENWPLSCHTVVVEVVTLMNWVIKVSFWFILFQNFGFSSRFFIRGFFPFLQQTRCQTRYIKNNYSIKVRPFRPFINKMSLLPVVKLIIPSWNYYYRK